MRNMGDSDPVASGDCDGSRNEHQKKSRVKRLIEVTSLSPQEAKVFARHQEETTEEIANRLDIETSTVESIKYRRIPDKLKEAENTYRECRFQWSFNNPIVPQPDTNAYALIGCSGPDCDADCDPNVQTATTNPGFNDFYTKTVNVHDDPSRIENKLELVFCSLNCLNDFEKSHKKFKVSLDKIADK